MPRVFVSMTFDSYPKLLLHRAYGHRIAGSPEVDASKVGHVFAKVLAIFQSCRDYGA
jgi:hypothetical protein